MKQISIFLIFTLVITLLGCKDSDRDQDTSTNSSADYATGQSIMYDVFKLVHQAALSSKGITTNNLADTTSLFGCDTLIVDTMSTPKSITIQFNGNCTGNNAERTGSITATYSSKYDAIGCVVSISFNNYTYKGYPIGSGNISYSFTGLSGTSPIYSYSVNKVQIENSKNQLLTWSGNQTLTVTGGETTATISDDTYSISGTASGTAFAGNDFSVTINNDLMYLGSCNWISSGIATVSPENKPPRLLDFGAGCDDKASVKIYSIEYEIAIL